MSNDITPKPKFHGQEVRDEHALPLTFGLIGAPLIHLIR
jgi:hypothetical protein